jgi:hypothetical protein
VLVLKVSGRRGLDLPNILKKEASVAEKKQPDFAATWQQFIGEWERQVNDLSAKISGNEMFAGPMNQTAKMTYAARSSLNGALVKVVETMQLASQAQMTEVIARLDRIEERLDHLIAATAPPPTAAIAEPRRTRRPPTS